MKKIFTIASLLVLTTTLYSQEKKEITVIFGQEMSELKIDKDNQPFSTIEIEYGVEGSDISKGDTLYHNNLAVVDDNGYPFDLDYKIERIKERPKAYKIVAIR